MDQLRPSVDLDSARPSRRGAYDAVLPALAGHRDLRETLAIDPISNELHGPAAGAGKALRATHLHHPTSEIDSSVGTPGRRRIKTRYDKLAPNFLADVFPIAAITFRY